MLRVVDTTQQGAAWASHFKKVLNSSSSSHMFRNASCSVLSGSFVVEEARVLIACNRAAPTELTPTQALEAANVIYHRH